jgi:cyclopropane fatty-acyl-phospholipid synthase-like methyltransferase
MIKKLLRNCFRHPIAIRQSWIDTPGELRDLTAFLSWFDRTESIQDTQKRSGSDWANKITAFPQYHRLSKETCLEIGFGGGRLLVEASKDFTRAIGIDIHAAFDKTMEYIALHHRDNITLLHKDDMASIPDASVDFIFSFIVFQHFDSYAEVEFYLTQIKRLLTPTGYAHLFFAKHAQPGTAVIDPRDFKKRKCSLFIEPAWFRDALSKDFDVVDFQDVMKKRIDQPVSKKNESEQARVVFRRRPVSLE